jgi:ribosomal protein S1
MTATVRSLTDFGAFCDSAYVDGLLHISDGLAPRGQTR